ncbi:MAG: AMP-dependent synthetase [Bacteroidetes bacterium]|jgi:long-chain acyl-CoA synthetase|nr:AMP-dependent synthetase [Bacteroidota bacterium]
MEVTRVFDILQMHVNTPKPDILAFKENKEWKKVSTQEFLSKVDHISAALLDAGILPGDKVSIIANNIPDWNFIDYGAQQIGVVTVPIFPTASAHDMEFILKDSEVKAIFFSSKDIANKIEAFKAELPSVKHMYTFNDDVTGFESFKEFIEKGKALFESPAIGAELKTKIRHISNGIQKDDLLTILYTSGTTGKPKGVMLSHENIISNVKACLNFAPFERMSKALSFLPLNHVYERMLNTLYLYNNISIYYAEGFDKIADNLKEIHPQMFVTVPRLMERVYDKLVSAGEKLGGAKKKIFFWALDLALNYEMYGKNGAIYELKRKIADKLVYSKWREALGGEIICIASGGAALQPRLAMVFNCAKLTVLEGYGLTETSPVIAVNSMEPDSIRIGTVGPVLKDLDVKIAEDGEILVKGPSVMKGYYKNEEATKEVIDDAGYFHTGDIGTFVEGRFLKITDRKKEIFKTSAGKYIAPLMIENKMKECRLIEQAMVIGEGQKFASALVVPAIENVKDWCKTNKIDFVSNEHIIQNEQLRKEINTFLREMNKSLAPYEQIKRVELLSKNWTIDSGEMTPKLSMKRKVIKENNKALIDKIFASGED